MPSQNGNAKPAPSPAPTSHFLPYKIPTLEYTLQNILISLFTLLGSLLTLIFTFCLVLPLSLVRTAVLPSLIRAGVLRRGMLDLPGGTRGEGGRGKVVLIVGASRGIGLEVLKQYVPEPDTTVIAVSKDREAMQQAIIHLGDTPATVQVETLDLAQNPKTISDAVKALDSKYGPISHLYAISGISNHLDDGSPWNLDATEKMIQINVSGIVALSMTMYERMKTRRHGKICIVGSLAGIYSPANMISYASTKSFINTFSASLRILAAAYGVDVVTVQPGFVDTRMTRAMRAQGSSVPGMEFASAEEVAGRMKRGVERGGVGVVAWPVRQSVVVYALKSLNPICDELGRFVAMKAGVAGKKIT